MEEKEGFVKNSKIAMYGVLNGILGSVVYEIVLLFIVSFFVVGIISGQNPNASSEELQELVNNAYDSMHYQAGMSFLISLVTLIVFIVIIKFDTFKELCKKAINSKTIKYGIITALAIMGFTIVYKLAVINIFNLESGDNANQDSVEMLVRGSPFLGFILVVLLAPSTEELTYRYCMFGEISKRKKWLGYLTSGLVFMAMHGVASYTAAGGFNSEFAMELIYLPPYLFSGLALCYAYDKTNNIGSSFVAHLFNNLVSFLSIVCL